MSKASLTETTKKALRRNIRHCKRLFYDPSSVEVNKQRVLIERINSMHSLDVRIIIYSFGVYGNATYVYDKNVDSFIQKKTRNVLFPEKIASKEFIKAINENTFIVLDVL